MISIAYVAGFLDGDGCITFANTRNRGGAVRPITPVLSFANTNLGVLEDIRDFIGPYGSWLHAHIMHNDKHKQQYQLTWASRSALDIVKYLEPHLIIKKAQANLLLEFAEEPKHCYRRPWTQEDRDKYYLKMKELNQKGRQ